MTIAKNKGSVFTGLLLLLIVMLIFSLIAPASKPTAGAEVFTSAKAMCLMEATTGKVLYSKNENAHLAMASTTKIMTAITAIENCDDLDEKFVISPKAVGISGTSIYLRKDEAMSIRDLLYGLMLVSGNDASVAIGERVGGNVKTFVNMMNETAKKIGANDSHFDNTHGLDSKTHYTTAKDLALITSYALKNDTFRDVVSTKYKRIVNTDGKVRDLRNKNKLLHTFAGCIGVKTGFTDDAGRCLVSSAERNGLRLVCVVLNCGPMFEESASLLEQGFREYRMVDLTQGYDFKRYIKLENGEREFVEIGTKGSFMYPIREDELVNIRYVCEVPQTLNAPIIKDAVVGKISIYYDKDLLFSEKIYTMEEVRGSFWERIKSFIAQW